MMDGKILLPKIHLIKESNFYNTFYIILLLFLIFIILYIIF